MPSRIIHPDTGFIEFNKTESEIEIDNLKIDNKKLREEVESIKSMIREMLKEAGGTIE